MHKSLMDRWQTAALLLLLFAHFLGHLVMKPQVVRYAYVDPGAGFLALQILGASVMGGFYLLRRKLRSLFSRFKPKRSADGTANQAD